MVKQWRVRALPSQEDVHSLSEKLNINSFLATLLLQRGISTFDKAKDFFRPSLTHLYDPFLMKDMNRAVERLSKAVDGHEKIMVYGDYDVDGTTAVAMMYDCLHRIIGSDADQRLIYYIPDRYTEGYGISFAGIDYAKQEQVSLIIALDCGIKSIDKIAYAKEKNIDFIICDHHNPGDLLPNAVAVLDPKRSDCLYPFKELSGCGVGYKLLQAFLLSYPHDNIDLTEYLDVLTVSIAADIVPMVDENRVFCHFGLQRINSKPRPGLAALIGVAGFKADLTITNVVFGLAPRINAAGRIAHGKGAVKLLLSNDMHDAKLFAASLNDHNSSRKDLDTQITAEAIAQIEAQVDHIKLKSTVLFKEDWHKGVIGIVASRCIERHYKPTIVLTHSNGKATGSARSVDGFDVYEAITACEHLLEQYGGHTHAAGMTMKIENVMAFRAAFEEVVCKLITEEVLTPKVDIDIEVELRFVNQKVYNIIKQMSPFGPGNMQPVFMTKQLRDNGGSREVGDGHLKLDLRSVDGYQMQGIAFGAGALLKRIKAGEIFDICYTIQENTFRDVTSLQLMVKEIRFSNDYGAEVNLSPPIPARINARNNN